MDAELVQHCRNHLLSINPHLKLFSLLVHSQLVTHAVTTPQSLCLVQSEVERLEQAVDAELDQHCRNHLLMHSQPVTHAVTTPQSLCLVQSEVERLEQAVDAEAARADYILDAADENIDAFAHTLDQQKRRHQHRKQAELRRQRQTMANVAAEELVQERRQRMAALKQVTESMLVSHSANAHEPQTYIFTQ